MVRDDDGDESEEEEEEEEEGWQHDVGRETERDRGGEERRREGE